GRLQIHIYDGCCYFYGMPSLEKGKEYTIQVTTAGGKAIEGATIKLDGATAGTTDENGELLWEPEDDGEFTLTASMGSYADGSRDVKVEEGPSTPGFGFAALIIGLLGAALILWRRRR
ncbi:MAG: PGF-CTERM sorting domain-containing protein, partial [Thermoplasmatota archaeon]